MIAVQRAAALPCRPLSHDRFAGDLPLALPTNFGCGLSPRPSTVDVVLPAGQASAGLAMQWRIMPTKDSPNAGGFIVTDIVPGTPASLANGMRRGLALAQIDGTNLLGLEKGLAASIMAGIRASKPRRLRFHDLSSTAACTEAADRPSPAAQLAPIHGIGFTELPAVPPRRSAKVASVNLSSDWATEDEDQGIGVISLAFSDELVEAGLYDRRHFLNQCERSIHFIIPAAAAKRVQEQMRRQSLEDIARDWLNDPFSTPARRRRLIHAAASATTSNYMSVAVQRVILWRHECSATNTIRKAWISSRVRRAILKFADTEQKRIYAVRQEAREQQEWRESCSVAARPLQMAIRRRIEQERQREEGRRQRAIIHQAVRTFQTAARKTMARRKKMRKVHALKVVERGMMRWQVRTNAKKEQAVISTGISRFQKAVRAHLHGRREKEQREHSDEVEQVDQYGDKESAHTETNRNAPSYGEQGQEIHGELVGVGALSAYLVDEQEQNFQSVDDVAEERDPGENTDMNVLLLGALAQNDNDGSLSRGASILESERLPADEDADGVSHRSGMCSPTSHENEEQPEANELTDSPEHASDNEVAGRLICAASSDDIVSSEDTDAPEASLEDMIVLAMLPGHLCPEDAPPAALRLRELRGSSCARIVQKLYREHRQTSYLKSWAREGIRQWAVGTLETRKRKREFASARSAAFAIQQHFRSYAARMRVGSLRQGRIEMYQEMAEAACALSSLPPLTSPCSLVPEFLPEEMKAEGAAPWVDEVLPSPPPGCILAEEALRRLHALADDRNVL